MNRISRFRIMFCALLVLIVLISAILYLYVQLTKQDETEETQEETETEQLESIYTVLPYESEGFSIYYYADTQTFTINIRQLPYDRNLEDALVFLHKYEETKDFTEDDVRIVAPSYMYEE